MVAVISSAYKVKLYNTILMFNRIPSTCYYRATYNYIFFTYKSQVQRADVVVLLGLKGVSLCRVKISSFNHIAEHMSPLGDNSGHRVTCLQVVVYK